MKIKRKEKGKKTEKRWERKTKRKFAINMVYLEFLPFPFFSCLFLSFFPFILSFYLSEVRPPKSDSIKRLRNYNIVRVFRTLLCILF